jgi:hypothetical protein
MSVAVKVTLDLSVVSTRVTRDSEATAKRDSRRRWPEDGFEEIAIDVPEARLWIACGWPRTRQL